MTRSQLDNIRPLLHTGDQTGLCAPCSGSHHMNERPKSVVVWEVVDPAIGMAIARHYGEPFDASKLELTAPWEHVTLDEIRKRLDVPDAEPDA